MKTKSVFILGFLLLTGLNSFCQEEQIETIENTKIVNENGEISFVEFANTHDSRLLLSNAKELLRTVLQLKAEDDYELYMEIDDELGFIHQKYQQYYRGFKVESATYIVHAKDNYVKAINGDFFRISDISVELVVSEEEALLYALDYAGEYQTDDFYYPTIEKVIVKDRLKTNKNYRLAYKIALDRDCVFVDAITGEVVEIRTHIFEGTSEKIKHIATQLGGCNDDYANVENVPNSRENVSIADKTDTVVISKDDNFMNIFIGCNYTCGAPFTTKCEIKDDTVFISLIDACTDYQCYQRCDCYYTFDFVFEQLEENDYKYKIQLFDPRKTYPIIFSEGSIKKSITGLSNGTGISQATLYQNAPNPFKERTEIRYSLPENANTAEIYVFGMQGKLLKKYPADQSGAVVIKGSDLKAGIYLYSLIVAGKQVDTKRMN
jgi:hypothetical protein